VKKKGATREQSIQLGEKIKTWLYLNGDTLADVSRKYKIPRSTLEAWISGTRSPTISHLIKLGISVDFLLYGRPKPALPYFGEDVTLQSEKDLYEKAFRELIAILESCLRMEGHILAYDVYKEQYGDRWEEERYREILEHVLFQLKMISSLYFSLYFGAPVPIITGLWFLEVLSQIGLKNSMIADVIERLRVPLSISRTMEVWTVEEEKKAIFEHSPSIEEMLSEIESDPVIMNILEKEEKIFGKNYLYFREIFPIVKEAIYRFDTALKLRKLPLVCFVHMRTYYGASCPDCEKMRQLLLKKNKGPTNSIGGQNERAD